MNSIDNLINDLPDAEAARRFLVQFEEKHPAHYRKLAAQKALLDDVLTLAAYSQLLGQTMIQNPDYIWWLKRKRQESIVRDKSELHESLARFALINSGVEPQIIFARFRRRELMRIYLRDIRRIGTIAEITEEISNLADVILEYAFQISKQAIDNRFGQPLETDIGGREKPATFCIVSLGKLGSKELNYSSDIDLMFLYSADGTTSGNGSRGATSNREYFIKLAEQIVKLVGNTAGEGAAYRVDLRLRPNGSVGALALSVKDTTRYYSSEAQRWELQVLIRSRACAGDASLFTAFYSTVADRIFSKSITAEEALRDVRNSKDKIDLNQAEGAKFNVKLGKGGIREIEFIAQALQLAYGGADKWLRSSHTLISLSRLADRSLLSDKELTELFESYEFLRHLEHILQMEHGLQTHSVPDAEEKLMLVARRMKYANVTHFNENLQKHTAEVSRIFKRLFAGDENGDATQKIATRDNQTSAIPSIFRTSFEKSGTAANLPPATIAIIEKVAEVSPKFSELIAASPSLINELPNVSQPMAEREYLSELAPNSGNFTEQMSELRKAWAKSMLEIAIFDILDQLSLPKIKYLQTKLAEASIAAAVQIATMELGNRLSIKLKTLPVAILALGKLGSGGLDYDSDLDLVIIYDETRETAISGISNNELYSRFVEIFVGVLSNTTRDGSLYRVDLRLRPHGKNGKNSISAAAFNTYFKQHAAIWELLAYVKIRAVGGDKIFAETTENVIREAIHHRASLLDANELRNETLNLRRRLEKEKTAKLRSREIDIKFGGGGMLDVYFAIRFLQLVKNLPDEINCRATIETLLKLRDIDAVSAQDLQNLMEGYGFLSLLDHQLRLVLGRSTRVPLANKIALTTVATRMGFASTDALFRAMNIQRLNIRNSFDNILREQP